VETPRHCTTRLLIAGELRPAGWRGNPAISLA
jgi:hypothetical protein